MYQYKRRMPKRRMRDYFMPFFIILLILAIIIFGWRTLNRVLIDDNKGTLTEKVFLNIENGSAKAMTVGKSEWKNVPDSIYLYSGEKLKTGSDGRATLTFSDQSLVRLDKNTEVTFVNLTKKDGTSNNEIDLAEGQIWSGVEKSYSPNSSFTVNTDLLMVNSKEGNIGVTEPGTVYVLDGSAEVSLKSNNEVVKVLTVGVGQELNVTEEKISQISEGLETELIFALSDSFKSSNWYRWNMKLDGSIDAYEESDEEEDGEVDSEGDSDIDDEEASDEEEDESDEVVVDGLISITKPSENSATNDSSITIEGTYDSSKVEIVYVGGKKATVVSANKWKVYDYTFTLEGENSLTVEAEDSTGVKTELESFIITYDKTAPATPKITDPGANGETVTIEDIEQIISGTVTSDTYAVIVNDYKLGKYVPGGKEWQYYAKTAYGNLEAGSNEYIVYAEDKAGNQSEPATIVLVLEQEVIDTAEEEGEDVEEDEESLPESSSEGGVSITGPNDGESFTTSDTEFEIIGEVPSSTAKVVVNDYTLSLYEAGSTTFKYSAKSSFGNLEIGEKNTYTVKAYDEDDTLLGSASITIDVESGSAAAPTITMPTSAGTYTTTLNEIVIGGDIGKWVQKVYVNDELLSAYIPGSEEWRKTVTLESGDNTFTIYGESEGGKTSSVSITITYQ